MKRILAILLLFSSLQVIAQDGKISIGIKGGANISYISNTGNTSINYWGMSSSSQTTARLLPHLGVYSEIKLDEIFTIQPELLFTMKGFNSTQRVTNGGNSSQTDYDLTLSYLDIPILIRANLGRGFHLMTGPYIGCMLAAKSKSSSIVVNGSNVVSSSSSSTSKDNFNTIEGGAYIGAGYQLENGLNFGIRWCRSFTDLNDNGGTKNANSAFQFSLGFRIKTF